ncbi:hypothetical protein L1049_008135 [Liquidambar formosana]|uniref:Uncharacterized protein n=1 Tax=Liquidambar formosana TaxID=63359 RepID=A0AAP0X831_LIQFO
MPLLHYCEHKHRDIMTGHTQNSQRSNDENIANTNKSANKTLANNSYCAKAISLTLGRGDRD